MDRESFRSMETSRQVGGNGTVGDGVENVPTSATDACNCMKPSDMESHAGLMEMPSPETEALKNPKRWFVMRDLKRPNAKLPAYKLLEKEKIHHYTPMHHRIATRNGRSIRVLVPVIHGLLFACDTYERMASLVESTPTLQFRYLKGRYHEPMVVRDSDMENFIQAGEDHSTTRYYTPEELTPQMVSRRVRVIGGPFDQREGTLITRRGTRTKRLLVGISSVLYKSVVIKDYDYIEFLP